MMVVFMGLGLIAIFVFMIICAYLAARVEIIEFRYRDGYYKSYADFVKKEASQLEKAIPNKWAREAVLRHYWDRLNKFK